MINHNEIEAEIDKLKQLKDLDEFGVIISLVTLVTLEWVLGYNPVSPSKRLVEVPKADAWDGAIDLDQRNIDG